MEVTQQNHDKAQYKKLSDFIRRVNNRHITDDVQRSITIQGAEAREKLVPRLPASHKKCQIEFEDGTKHEISMHAPALGPEVLDGQELHKKTGLFTFDPGFTSTASCVS